MDKILSAKFHDGSSIKYVKFPEELNHVGAVGSGSKLIVNTGYTGEEETEITEITYTSQTSDKFEDKRKLPSINEAIELAIENRYEDIVETKILTNKRYVDARSKVIELQKQIMDIIPAESKKILMEYSDAEVRMSVIETTLFYKQGLRDGLALRKAWGGAM